MKVAKISGLGTIQPAGIGKENKMIEIDLVEVVKVLLMIVLMIMGLMPWWFLFAYFLLVFKID